MGVNLLNLRRVFMSQPQLVQRSGSFVNVNKCKALPINKLDVELIATKNGSGTASLDNIVSLNGIKSVKLYQAGDNLFIDHGNGTRLGSVTFSWEDGQVKCVGGTSGNEVSSTNAGWKNIGKVFLKAGTYYVRIKRPSYTGTFQYGNIRNYSTGASILNLGNSTSHGTFSLSEDTTVYWSTYLYHCVINSTDPYLGISIAKVDIAVEPSVGNVTAVDLGLTSGAVRRGTLDLLSGELAISAIAYTADEFPSYTKSTSTSFDEFLFRTAGIIAPDHSSTTSGSYIQCSHARPGATAGATYAQCRIASSQPRILFPVGAMPTLSDFSTWLLQQEGNGTPLQFWYTVDPVTYKLAGNQQRTLKGVNNIWTDAGSGDLTLQAWVE